MKTLYLIRHAKSSWNFSELDDHDRPLGKRGRKDIVKMGKWLASYQLPPHQIISSTANRALTTALFMADKWGVDETNIQLSKELYHSSKQQILDVLHDQAKHNLVAIFGHNPGFTSFANWFLRKPLDNIPTCGALGLQFDIPTWEHLEPHTANKIFYYTPKQLKK